MEWTPLRFGWRELSLSKGRATLVAGILGLQASALAGGIVGFQSLFHTRDTYYEDLRFADLEVQFVPATVPEMPPLEELAKLPGVAAVDRRFVSLGYIERGTGPDARTLPVVVHYLEPESHPKVNDIEVTRGRFLSVENPDSIVVDRIFAEHHGLALGDPLVVNPNRFAMRFTVGGVALSPEYLVPTANPDLMVPDKGSLGVVFASRKKLDALFVDPLYNQLVFRYSRGADPAQTKAKILGALSTLDVERATPKEANFGYRYVEEVIGGSRIFMPATATLLALIAAIATMVSMRRILTARRREMGGLLAHGYTPWQLVSGFMLFGLVPGIVGALLGIPGGAALGTNLANGNADVAGMPTPKMFFAPEYFAIGGASALLVGLVSVLVPALSLTRLSPAHALRGGEEVRFRGLPPFVERLVGGSLSLRYATRNLFRRVRLSFATAWLIALSVAMPASMLTILSCWDAWTDTYVKGIKWDVTASFKVPLDAKQTRAAVGVSGVADYEGWMQKSATLLRAGAGDQEVRVRGLAVPTRLAPLDLVAGSYFSKPDAREAILNTAFSRGAPPPKVGDRVTVVYKGARHELSVVGTISDGSIQTIYVPLETAQGIFDAHGKLSGVNLVLGEGAQLPPLANESLPPPGPRPEAAESIDLDTEVEAPAPTRPWFGKLTKDEKLTTDGVKRALLANEMVTAVQAKSDFRDATTRYLRVFHSITIPLIGEGCVLAFFFLVSMLSFLLLEREPEYATLRTMGYGRAEIAKMVFIEVLALAGGGLFLSLATWLGVTRILLELMKVAWFRIPLAVRSSDWLLVAAPIGMFLVLAAVPGIRGLMKMDLAAATRSRAMG